jgi:hypothetical protein
VHAYVFRIAGWVKAKLKGCALSRKWYWATS